MASAKSFIEGLKEYKRREVHGSWGKWKFQEAHSLGCWRLPGALWRREVVNYLDSLQREKLWITSQLSFVRSEETSRLKKLYDRNQEWDVELGCKSVCDERQVLRPSTTSVGFRGVVVCFFFLRRGGRVTNEGFYFTHREIPWENFTIALTRQSGSHCGFSSMSSSHITRVLEQWLMEIIHWCGTLAKNIWFNYPYNLTYGFFSF